MNPLRRLATSALVETIVVSTAVSNAHADQIAIDWVTVGDPGPARRLGRVRPGA